MAEYWESRYSSGGNSGNGSIGALRDWKWNQISKHIGEVNDVIDMGCGDLEFMKHRHPVRYVGIDISKTIIERNESLHPEWKFHNVDASGLRANVVFCHDILFHIVDDGVYYAILNNLIQYAYNYISIYSGDRNPIPWWNLKAKYYGSNKYQKFRNFDMDVDMFESSGFQLISKTKTNLNRYGAMYIFKNSR